MRVAAVVPSLNPDDKFLEVIRQLAEAGFPRIFVVDDGSDPEFAPLFRQAAQYPQCTLLRHQKNCGKGRALKTAFAEYLKDPGDCLGVVTLDGDGQHGTPDVLHCAAALEEHPRELVLGVRNFADPGVPPRSATGNRVTRTALRIFFGLHVTDSQTGLRGIPNFFLETLLALPGERYEFETNMLMDAKARGIPFLEVPIQTIYFNNNVASHYRTVVDSVRIFLPLVRFAFSGLSSAVLDVCLFALLNWVFAALEPALRYLIAVAGARVCSAVYNFLVNRRLVFQSRAKPFGSFVRYALLCLAMMGGSYGGTLFLSEVVHLPAVLSKVLVDMVLFIVSFRAQRLWVFRRPPP